MCRENVQTGLPLQISPELPESEYGIACRTARETTEKLANVVDRGSHRDYHGGDCCGRAAVTIGWRGLCTQGMRVSGAFSCCARVVFVVRTASFASRLRQWAYSIQSISLCILMEAPDAVPEVGSMYDGGRQWTTSNNGNSPSSIGRSPHS
jgi:hypothetical protein